MSSIGTALSIWARAGAELDALGDRLAPVQSAQGDAIPMATYQIISSDPDESLQGDLGHQTDRIQFDVYGDVDNDPEPIARKLRQRLLAAYGQLPTQAATSEPYVDVTGISTAGGIHDGGANAPVDGSDQWQHRATFDLIVSYHPPA